MAIKMFGAQSAARHSYILLKLKIKKKHQQYAINNSKNVLCGFGIADIKLEKNPNKSFKNIS
jgi:hypothetical protein